MLTIKIEPINDNEKVVINRANRTITALVCFEKRKQEDTLFRYAHCVVQYDEHCPESLLADIQALNKRGKAFIEEELLNPYEWFELKPRPQRETV